MLEMPKVIIMASGGTEPTKFINMESGGKISMSHPEAMGRVRDGFWTALMYESEEVTVTSFFDRSPEAESALDRWKSACLIDMSGIVTI